MFQIRAAVDADKSALLQLWHDGWHDAHAHLVPPEVLRFRTPEFFAAWLNECADQFFIASNASSLLGFVSIKEAELVKLYASREALGTGVAKALLAHAETTILERGFEKAVLFCTAGNSRAERFYVREGWYLARTFEDDLWTPVSEAARYSMQTHQYEKNLALPKA